MSETMCERCGRSSYSNDRVTVRVETLQREAWMCVPCARIVKQAILFVWPLPTLPPVTTEPQTP